jgi:hypothetical protein
VTRNPRLRHAVPQFGSAYDRQDAALAPPSMIVASVEPDLKQGGHNRRSKRIQTGES